MINILTSGFSNGFPPGFKKLLKTYIKTGMTFAFIASEFENIHEKTDWYCNHFLRMFADCKITFSSVNVIDGRMPKETAQKLVRNADVIWLAGGDTPTQFACLKSYELISSIREQKGVVLGMSAGAINMAKKAVCTVTCGHKELKIYEALGLVDFSVEPHFDNTNITEELLEVSKEYPLYGILDDSAIICTEGNILYVGDVFLIENRTVTKVSPSLL
ncbi:MAG: Type 1 glutamine amidotransferase-like domain-containing protein [Firmicutes bacterium]|nr:Type 1 glutamine amidotransferase-like domain-containing protein [Bacillota bacterium]MDD4694695.1 Type 1 glutamine amidotransferase-like domain-containing protein [Bacillota bacterium]